MIHNFKSYIACTALLLATAACDKKGQPGMTDFPEDKNPPGGPLKFYAAFDGTSTDKLRNAVDSIRANFPSDNGFESTDGVTGKAMKGSAKKFIKYTSFNDWVHAESFTVSAWFKIDGQTKNNVGGNGPEYIFSMRSNPVDYHWSNAVMFVFLEGNNTACAVKVMCVSPSSASDPNSSPTDAWFTWENAQMIPGILNNAWHHLVLTYDAGTSAMTLFIDGVANPNVKTWPGHGAIRLSKTKIGEFRIGRGPRDDGDGDGEAGWLQSSLKGNLDQFRLYNKVLTQAEISALYTSKL